MALPDSQSLGVTLGRVACYGCGAASIGIGQRYFRIFEMRGYQEEFFYGLCRAVDRYADGGRASAFACTDVLRSDRGVGVVYAEVGR